MDNKYYMDLVINWQIHRCLKSRNQIITDVTKLIQSVVNQFKHNNNKDDLFNEGVIGVMQACDTYDFTEGSFLTYAKTCARYNILDYIRQDTVIPRGSSTMHSHNLSYSPVPTTHSEAVELARKKNVPYDTVVKYATMGKVSYTDQHDPIGIDSTSSEAEFLEECERLEQKLNLLDTREYNILNRFFIHEDTQTAIAEDLGVSDQRIGQIIKNTVNKLRL